MFHDPLQKRTGNAKTKKEKIHTAMCFARSCFKVTATLAL